MSVIEKPVRFLVKELEDPSAPVPEEVAIERLGILFRALTLPALVLIVQVTMGAVDFPALMALIGVIGVLGGLKAPAARERIVSSTMHAIWGISGIVLLGGWVLHFISSPQHLEAVFGISVGRSASEIYDEVAPIILVISSVIAVIYEVRMVITEVRQVQARHDARRWILGITRTRRDAIG